MLDVELGPIRPPSESQSLLIRVTRGCHWNKCSFCGLYKNIKFSMRPTKDILKDIEIYGEYYAKQNRFFRSCFLQDGDALHFPTKDLLQILNAIKKNFPTMQTVTTYARADSVLKKSEAELLALSKAGLNHFYRGIETGSNTILKNTHKGITADDIVTSGLMCKRAGITLSEFTLLGIGGRELAEENAIETARVINKINPDFIRVHHAAFKPKTKAGRDVEKGLIQLQSEEEIVREQKLFIEQLDGIDSYYVNEHIVNLLLEVRGKLPDSKKQMLAVIDNYLSMSDTDKLNFALGRRFGKYRYIMDMQNEETKESITKYISANPNVDFNKLCNDYRAQTI